MSLRKLQELSTELGDPGVQALWLAAKRRGLDVQRREVASWVASRSEKQVLAPPQRAAGKTTSEDDNRWQMDLVDVSNAPAGGWRFLLVCVNVLDRFMYARPLHTKQPQEVAEKLLEIGTEGRSRRSSRPIMGWRLRGP